MATRTASAAATRNGVRCAIYTRKSTEEGLEQAFNSLDAQREACAAYIASQRHEGWIEVRAAYDDGGYSGGSMERPALQRLLADVRAGQVDVIVVYKVDRLTRALSDFAKIVEVLDARGASFVSVTQAFNTTTSMGRLTLNVLLSFAQFEREVTGERIRDKIAASKAKGMWMGGPVPLGYDVRDRKLVVDAADAITVRHVFARYAALGSGRALIAELRADGYRTKLRPQAGGPPRGGVPFERGMLFAMLANRVYLGEIVHKGVAVPGEHAAIIDQDLWDQVQATIAANKVARRTGTNLKAPSLLAGILVDAHGRRMSPSHAVKSGKRYRYYITPASDLVAHGPAPWRLPAHDLEAIVVARLEALLTSKARIARLIGPAADPHAITSAIGLAQAAAARLATHYGRKTIVGSLVQQVRVDEQQVTLTLDRRVLLRMLAITSDDDAPLQLTAPAVRVRHGKDVKLVLATDAGTAAQHDDTLAALLAEAIAARDLVLAQPDKPIRTIAAETGQCRTRLAQLVRLSWIAPAIAATIARGEHPATLTPRQLLAAELPICWTQQQALLGLA